MGNQVKTYSDSEVTVHPKQYDDSEISTSPLQSVATESQKMSSTPGKLLDSFIGLAGPGPYFLKHEELLPLLGQVGGGIAGEFINPAGGGLPGSVAGASTGNALKQGIEMLKGKRKDFSALEVGKDAALTGLFEGAFRLPAFLAYRKLRASQELAGGLTADMALMKGQISKIQNAVPIDDVLNPLTSGMDEIAVKSGPQAAQLTKWKLKLEALKKAGETHIDGRTMVQMEEQLGEIAQFKNPSVFGIEIPTHVKNKAANRLSKEMRNTVSNKVDYLAKSQGLESWPIISKKISELMKITSKNSNSMLDGFRRGTLDTLVGGMVGSATHNPVAGFGAGMALEAFTNPVSRNIGFKALEQTGIGRAATIGATEAGRRLTNES